MEFHNLEEEIVSEFVPIDGPIRIVPSGKPGHHIAVNRMGHFLAGGRECALRPMADAFNATKEWDGEEESVKVTACPACGYPIEEQGAEKCLSCLNPEPKPEPVQIQDKKKEPQETLSEWL